MSTENLTAPTIQVQTEETRPTAHPVNAGANEELLNLRKQTLQKFSASKAGNLTRRVAKRTTILEPDLNKSGESMPDVNEDKKRLNRLSTLWDKLMVEEKEKNTESLYSDDAVKQLLTNAPESTANMERTSMLSHKKESSTATSIEEQPRLKSVVGSETKPSPASSTGPIEDIPESEKAESKRLSNLSNVSDSDTRQGRRGSRIRSTRTNSIQSQSKRDSRDSVMVSQMDEWIENLNESMEKVSTLIWNLIGIVGPNQGISQKVTLC